jgi:hypothetical protein
MINLGGAAQPWSGEQGGWSCLGGRECRGSAKKLHVGPVHCKRGAKYGRSLRPSDGAEGHDPTRLLFDLICNGVCRPGWGTLLLCGRRCIVVLVLYRRKSEGDRGRRWWRAGWRACRAEGHGPAGTCVQDFGAPTSPVEGPGCTGRISTERAQDERADAVFVITS